MIFIWQSQINRYAILILQSQINRYAILILYYHFSHIFHYLQHSPCFSKFI